MPLSETQLVQAATRGDQAALGDLLQTYQHRIFNVCLRMVGQRDDAAELAQETMLKAIEHLHDFRGQSGFATWIIRIAMNLSISHLRKRRVRGTVNSLDAPGSADDQSNALRQQLIDHREPEPDFGVQKKELMEYLHTALERVDEEFRAVLVLRDIEEMDYLQIASVLSLPPGTVKSRLFRGRLALRQALAKLCPSAAAPKT